MPLAAADAVEWASRRIDLAVLGAFMPASFVGIYYVAQQVATLPAKLKTSFEPVLGPAIARKIAADDRAGGRQAGAAGRPTGSSPRSSASRWRSAIPGRAVMGLVGSGFTGGTAMLGFLLAAEVIAATAVVSEAALIYVARKRNMIISLAMLALEAGLPSALILIMKDEGLPQAFQATGPAIALCVALGFASIAKSRLLERQLGAPRVRLALGPGLGGRRGRRRRRAVRLLPAADAGSWSSASRRSSPPSAPCCGPRASGPRTASCSG